VSLICLGNRLVLARLKNGQQFREARLIRLAGRAIPILLNPFRMLLAERVVNLVLKLNVRANFVRAARGRVHFHDPTILVIGSSRHGASGGFYGTP
jgi:hypothetical protein